MNILESSFEYFRDILTENTGPKALVMDDETVKVLGLSITRTEILSFEVFATETLSDLQSKPRTGMLRSMSCICVIKPTNNSVELLCNELSEPHFSKYAIYFSNTVSEDIIRKLASFDRMQIVEKVEEIFTDFFPLNSRLFHAGIQSCAQLRQGSANGGEIQRMAESLFSALCALQIRPYVRYDSASGICNDLATFVTSKIIQTSTIFGPQKDNSLLLILDRNSDPITAIASAWYYGSAINTLFDVKYNVVTMPKDKSQFVLDERHDMFYAEYCNKFLAEIGPAVSSLAKEAVALNEASKQKISTPGQIASVVTAATQFQSKMSVAKEHIALVDAINKAVEEKCLLTASEVEQALATGDDAAFHASEIIRISQIPGIPHESIVRLALLFALRYEGRAPEQTAQVKSIAGTDGALLMDAVIQLCGAKERKHEDVFANKSALKRLFSDIRMITEAQPNVLSQYRCLLFDILRRVRTGSLDEIAYPTKGGVTSQKPQKIVVFYVGGATFEEERAAAEVSRGDIDVVVGGSFVHSPQSFVENEIQPFVKY